MSTILINASFDELRVAMLSNQVLDDFYYEHCEQKQNIGSKSNILKARVTRIEPGLEAAFVDFGGNRQGFLPFREISPEYYSKKVQDEHAAISIQDVMREGRDIMIQIMKEERGTKGAALTSYITLAGCYLVLMPNSPNAGGISRRIEGDDRQEMKEILSNLKIPDGMSTIIRTAGVDKSLDELQWDLDVLVHQWEAIRRAYNQRPAPFLIHQEGDVLIRTIRDHLRQDVSDIIIDEVNVFTKAKDYIEKVRPDYLQKLKLYQDDVPLFVRYQIERQVKSAFDSEVHLPSGGSIVIDKTEALTAIDINSAKSTHGSDIEETALHTNLEAADEIARQLRLRDIGGLIVIDFIDMTPMQHQREVENRLREALKHDRARIQIGRISRFGLLEMSRQRLHPTLGEVVQTKCPQCQGRGSVQNATALGATILRLIEEDLMNGRSKQVRVQLPLEVATLLLNEKRHAITAIEKRHNVEIFILPNPHLVLPHYKIEKIERSGSHGEQEFSTENSFNFIEKPKEPEYIFSKIQNNAVTSPSSNTPAVKSVVPEKPKEEAGLIRKIFSALFGSASVATKQPAQPVKMETQQQQRSSNYQHNKQRRHRRPRHEHYQGSRQQQSGAPQEGQGQGQRNRPPRQDDRDRVRQDNRDRPDDRGGDDSSGGSQSGGGTFQGAQGQNKPQQQRRRGNRRRGVRHHHDHRRPQSDSSSSSPDSQNFSGENQNVQTQSTQPSYSPGKSYLPMVIETADEGGR